MTKPTHVIVPVEPTEAMVDAALDIISLGPPAGEVWCAFLEDAPGAGKVSKEQSDLAADMLQHAFKEYEFPRIHAVAMVAVVVGAFGLEVKGDTE